MSRALVIVDMLNSYEHEDAERLCASVEKVLGPIAGLIERAQREGAPVIYVNDNYGDWSASRHDLARQALEGARPDLVEPVLPPDDMDFVIKARHTIFYMTPVEYLLGQRDIDHLVLVGQVTEQCILYSALDAYVRHLSVTVPPDAVAHIREDLADAALEMMETNMDAQLVPSGEVELKEGSWTR
jgi:nicotinamidase-related amidase